jgi:hypothetical protein
MRGQVLFVTFQAVYFPQAAVNLGHMPAAGTFVQAVNVLGNDMPQQTRFFKLHQGKVGRVGLVLAVVADKLAPNQPVFRWILPEHLGGSIHHGIIFLPESSFGPERRDTAFG